MKNYFHESHGSDPAYCRCDPWGDYSLDLTFVSTSSYVIWGWGMLPSIFCHGQMTTQGFTTLQELTCHKNLKASTVFLKLLGFLGYFMTFWYTQFDWDFGHHLERGGGNSLRLDHTYSDPFWVQIPVCPVILEDFRRMKQQISRLECHW